MRAEPLYRDWAQCCYAAQKPTGKACPSRPAGPCEAPRLSPGSPRLVPFPPSPWPPGGNSWAPEALPGWLGCSWRQRGRRGEAAASFPPRYRVPPLPLLTLLRPGSPGRPGAPPGPRRPCCRAAAVTRQRSAAARRSPGGPRWREGPGRGAEAVRESRSAAKRAADAGSTGPNPSRAWPGVWGSLTGTDRRASWALVVAATGGPGELWAFPQSGVKPGSLDSRTPRREVLGPILSSGLRAISAGSLTCGPARGSSAALPHGQLPDPLLSLDAGEEG